MRLFRQGPLHLQSLLDYLLSRRQGWPMLLRHDFRWVVKFSLQRKYRGRDFRRIGLSSGPARSSRCPAQADSYSPADQCERSPAAAYFQKADWQPSSLDLHQPQQVSMTPSGLVMPATNASFTALTKRPCMPIEENTASWHINLRYLPPLQCSKNAVWNFIPTIVS